MQMSIFLLRHLLCASILVATSLLAINALAQTHSYTPPGGMVPNEAVARAVAKVYLTAVYGQAEIESQLPLIVSLKDKVWTIKGSFNKKHSVGGVAEIDLAQQDGRVLRLTHSM